MPSALPYCRRPRATTQSHQLSPLRRSFPPPTSAQSSRQQILPTMGSDGAKRHLLVLQHGLFGHHKDWDRIIKCLSSKLDDSFLVHATSVNERKKSMQGVDVCGQRLAEEVKQLAAEHPEISTVSFVGLSMGGLTCRYAAAALLNTETGLMGGLKPGHYISVATPHLGCSSHPGYLNSTGFYSWKEMRQEMTASSHFNYGAHKFLVADLTPGLPLWVLSMAGQHSSLQIFLRDNAADPLLLKMVSDCDGLPFITALEAFRTRTTFSNTTGDMWINWPSACLRSFHELPAIDISSGEPCVVSREPSGKNQQVTRCQQQRQKPKTPNGRRGMWNPFARAHSRSGGARRSEDTPGVEADLKAPPATKHCAEEQKRQQQVVKMLRALQKLDWERIDVSFENASPDAARSSHDLIIQALPVRSSKMCHEGEASVEHIACYIAELLLHGSVDKAAIAAEAAAAATATATASPPCASPVSVGSPSAC